jgi:hypothetical protein
VGAAQRAGAGLDVLGATTYGAVVARVVYGTGDVTKGRGADTSGAGLGVGTTHHTPSRSSISPPSVVLRRGGVATGDESVLRTTGGGKALAWTGGGSGSVGAASRNAITNMGCPHGRRKGFEAEGE